MKNTLTDLNNYLFETLERLIDDDMTEESLKKEITRSQAVTAVACTIIQNGELALKAFLSINPTPEQADQIIAGVKRAQKRDPRFREERFIPYPATWLNARGWEDEHGTAKHANTDAIELTDDDIAAINAALAHRKTDHTDDDIAETR